MSDPSAIAELPNTDLRTLRALVATAPDGIVVVDEDGRLVLVNPRAEEMFGYSPGELVGRRIEVLVPDRFQARHTGHRERYTAAPRTRPMGAGLELSGRRRDGTEFPIDVSLSSVDVEGRRLVTAFVRDITARVEAENALRAAEQRFRSLVDSVPDYAILTLDPDGSITTWGVGAERLNGYRAEEVVGQPLDLLYPPEDAAAGVPGQHLEQAAQHGQVHTQGWRVRKDGTRFWADVSLTAFFERNGKLRGYAKVTRDLTEQRLVQTRLEALSDLNVAVLKGGSSEDVLGLAARRAREVVAGRLSWAAVPTDDGGHTVVAADGDGAAVLSGSRVPARVSSAASRLESGASAVVEWHGGDEPDPLGELGPTVIASLGHSGHVFGLLGVSRVVEEPQFNQPETRLLEVLAAQVAAALGLRAARLEVERLSLTEDQERIARDLHDTVIQRLFATGMTLQSTLRSIESDSARARIDQAIGDLDDTIRGIRTTIFGLQPRETVKRSVRQRVLEVTAEAADALGFEPAVHFEGAVDALIGPDILSQLLPTVREALSNVARHAEASEVVVTVQAADDVVLTVADDGRGLPGQLRTGGHGLSNMAERAQSLGGSFRVDRPKGRGTRLEWRIPSEVPIV